MEKAFIIEQKKEKDDLRQQMKTDVKGIGEKLESDIEKIEQKKKQGDTITKTEDVVNKTEEVVKKAEDQKTDVEKWLEQQKQLKKLD